MELVGDVGAGRDDRSRRVWLLSGDWGVLSSLEARRPFWYWERVTWERGRKKNADKDVIRYCDGLCPKALGE